MNTFFLIFLPLTCALANETKSIEPFTVHRAVNLTYSIAGLSAKGKEIIATFSKFDYPFQDIISGHKYKVKRDQTDYKEVLFVSKKKAYSLGSRTYALTEFNRRNGLLEPTFFETDNLEVGIAIGNDKRLFVSRLLGIPGTLGVRTIINTFKDGAFTPLRELDGEMRTFTLSPDNKKIYGILNSYENGHLKELIEISLNDNGTYYKLLAKTYNQSLEKDTVVCDKKGNIYVSWKKFLIEVYNSRRKTSPITSDYEIDHMAISNSEPQYLYVAGRNPNEWFVPPVVGRVKL
ncbi:hypothetical protein DSO57_1007132 [Entomophthora muscae]|uniref:Uncharacterized protein n=1 Tax=Entomophthora muscae TaxID=34485 RepID=A0ACC2SK63_9FUNG|nr:hypothetical protein DSO57_1007132 [Entomophthora muscae]